MVDCTKIITLPQKRLNEKLKYLIENMNLALCCELNEEVYLQVFDTISDLSEITVADLRFVHKTTSETTRLVSQRRENREHNCKRNLLSSPIQPY